MERGIIGRLSGLENLPKGYEVHRPLVCQCPEVVFEHSKLEVMKSYPETNIVPAPTGR